MSAKKLVKEYGRALKADPENLAVRLKLAGALREIGRREEALGHYLAVARAYRAKGRLQQAIAVCRGVLELDPAEGRIQELLAELDEATAARGDRRLRYFGEPDPSERRSSSAEGATVPLEDDGSAVSGPVRLPAPAAADAPPAQGGTSRPGSRAEAASGRPGTGGPGARGGGAASGPAPGVSGAGREVAAPRPPPAAPAPIEAGESAERAWAQDIDEVPGGRPAWAPAEGLDDAGSGDLPLSVSDALLEEEPDDGAPPPGPGPSTASARTTEMPARSSTARGVSPRPVPPHVPPFVPPGGPAPDWADTRMKAHGRSERQRLAARYAEPSSRDGASSELLETRERVGPEAVTRGRDAFDEVTRAATEAEEAAWRSVPDEGWNDRADDGRPWMDEALPAPVASGSSFDEEATRVDDDGAGEATENVVGLPTALRAAAGRPDAAPDPLRSGEWGREPFGDALDRMAPDGTPIEPLLGVFAELPPDAFDELQRRLTRTRVPRGETVVREGDAGTSCYIVEQGLLRVLKRDPAAADAPAVEVGRLGDGSLFGEFAVFTDRRRHATVQALEDSWVYEVPRELLQELTASHAGVGAALGRMFRERLISTLLATAQFFQPLPEEERVKLMARFAPRRLTAGEAAIREGEMAVGLYLVILGTVHVTREQDGQPRRLAELGEGSYFGEMSLLSAGPATATVTAAGDVELAHLPAKDFYDVVASFPVLWRQISQEARRRNQANHTLLTGDARTV